MSKTMNVEYDLWQVTKRTVNERIKFLYNNRLMADVNFLVTDMRGSCHPKIRIPCHRFVLAVASPVFFAMFDGKLAETSESIELPDCDSEGFLEFLRYLYCDDIRLTGSCIMQVLYLAKKYMVPSLVDRCRQYLESVLEAENVLTVLPLVTKLEELHLEKLCWNIVDKQSEAVLKSSQFTSLTDDKELLSLLLKRDSLNATEMNIFQALMRWTEKECTQHHVESEGLRKKKPKKRAVIGETVLSLIRFPLMSQKEFAETLPDMRLLKDKEVIQLFTYYSTGKNASKFSAIPRSNAIFRCKRFDSSSPKGQFCNYAQNAITRCCVDFAVDTSVHFRGVRLYGNERESYSVMLKIDEKIIVDDFFLTDAEMADGYYGFDVMFNQPYLLSCGKSHMIELLMRGPRSFCGCSGKEKVNCGGIMFTFSFSSFSGLRSNGPLSTEGQIAEILFHK